MQKIITQGCGGDIVVKLSFLFFLSILFIPRTLAQQVSFQTDFAVGEQIYLAVTAEGEVTAEGLEPSTIIATGMYTPYKVTAQSIKIKGDLNALECAGNKIASLDVTEAPNLLQLNCAGNHLTQLDLSNSTKLAVLDFAENQIEEVTITSCKDLETLHCQKNKLKAIDVSQCPKLTVLHCEKNQLAALDVSKNPMLTTLECYENQIEKLDLAANSNLEVLACNQNKISLLNLHANVKLTELSCYRNSLQSLDLSANKALQRLTCSNCELTALDLSSNTELTYLDVDDNKLSSISLSGNIKLQELYCNGNPINTIDLSANTQLTKLFLARCNLTVLDVTANEELQFLGCSKNKLTSFTFGKLPKIITLSLERNAIRNKEMTRIATSLKDCKGADDMPSEIYVVDTKYIPTDEATEPIAYPEHNKCTKANVALLKGKGWTVQNRNDGLVEEYEGIERDEATGKVATSPVRLFPTVATSYIELQGVPANCPYTLYNMEGSVVAEGKTACKGLQQVDVSSLPEGYYFVNIDEVNLRFYVVR